MKPGETPADFSVQGDLVGLIVEGTWIPIVWRNGVVQILVFWHANFHSFHKGDSYIPRAPPPIGLLVHSNITGCGMNQQLADYWSS